MLKSLSEHVWRHSYVICACVQKLLDSVWLSGKQGFGDMFFKFELLLNR